MIKLQGECIYLAALERHHCRQLFEDNEYNPEQEGEPPVLGFSMEKSDEWFEDIQQKQGRENLRLGIFLNDGTVIGDVALQDMDRVNGVCSLGMSIARIANRSKGYGREAVRLLLRHAFYELGFVRVTARTLETNTGGRLSLEKVGFTLEGVERKAVYCHGQRQDRLNYAMLREEFDGERGQRENQLGHTS